MVVSGEALVNEWDIAVPVELMGTGRIDIGVEVCGKGPHPAINTQIVRPTTEYLFMFHLS
jgi:hypothetical protein